MKRMRAGLALMAVLLILAAGCAPAAMPTSQEPAAEAPAAEQPAAEEPAANLPQATSEPETQAGEKPQPSATLAALPTLAPTQQSTQPAELNIQQPVVEARQVELEWPETIRLGDSDVIRLTLAPAGDMLQVTAEYPDHTVQTNHLDIRRTPGYSLIASARLDAVGLDVSPAGGQEYLLEENQPMTWRWSIQPRSAGQHRLSISLVLRWEPEPGTVGIIRETLAFNRSLEIEVTSFLGLTRNQTASAGGLGLAASVICAIAAWVVRRRGRSVEYKPANLNSSLSIEPGPGIALSGEETALLRGVFDRHERAIVESEFLSGYSGARTFVVSPVENGGVNQSRTIVKIGPRAEMMGEYDRYQRYVKDRLPPITARIQRAPYQVAGGSAAALQYTFIGQPGSNPFSLRRALLQNPDCIYLERLFETFGPYWWQQRVPYTFRPGVEYDDLLPVQAVLEAAAEASPSARLIDEQVSSADFNPQVGDVFRLGRFARVEVRPDGRSVTCLGAAGQPALRVRLQGKTEPAGVTARVIAARRELLRRAVDGLDLLGLPDPLERLDDVLARPLAGTRSVIHGDLNLENILVGPGELVWLIDFARTGEGHTLRDFACLYGEIIAHVLVTLYDDPRAFLADLREGRIPLLTCLDRMAGRCQFDPGKPAEFDLAVGITCLGALKRGNLPRAAKHLLYLTAAEKLRG